MPYSLDRRHFMRLAGLGATGLSALGAGLAGCSFATADTGGAGGGSGASGSAGSTPAASSATGPSSSASSSSSASASSASASPSASASASSAPSSAPSSSPSPSGATARPPAVPRPDGPNVIVIMTDQQRADVCRREGFPLDTTPFLDALAARGVWFNRAYTSCPACVPARTSFLTGRFPAAAHVRCNHNLTDAYYEKDLFTTMRERGYKTALIGKNHSFLKQESCDYWSPHDHMGRPPRDPEDEAFNAFLKSTRFHVALDPCPLPVASQNPVRMVDDARAWIDGLKGSPFFLWFSIPEPHNPYQVPEPYYSMFPPDSLPPTRTGPGDGLRKSEPFRLYDQLIHMGMPHLAEELPRMRSNYFGMLRLIDDQMKRFMEYLDERGLREKTIVLFVSDHGDFVGEYGWMRKGPDLPECLARVPMIWTGPGIAAGEGPHAAHVSMVDVFPTLCEATGAPILDGVQGRSLWPLLTGKPYSKEEFASAYVELGYGGLQVRSFENPTPRKEGAVNPPGGFDELNSWTQSGTRRMTRKGVWKLIFDMDGNGQLFNLAKDPSEMRNLFGDPSTREIEADLMKELMKWTLRAQDPLPYPRARYTMRVPPRGWRLTEDGKPA